MKIPDKLYDILKWVCIVALPALITCLGVVLPGCGVSADVVQMVTTIIGAIGTFIGALIGVSCYNYNKDSKDED